MATIPKNYINEKSFYGQATDSDIKRYEKIIKLTTGQGEGYITGCLLGYDYVKNHYRLIAVENKILQPKIKRNNIKIK